MKFPEINIRKEIKLAVILVIAFSAIAFVGRKQDSKKVRELNILIQDEGNNYFLSNEQVYSLITGDESDFIIGSTYDDIDLKTIENRVLRNQYVSTTQAFKDLSGNLTVKISLCRPMARIIRKDKTDSYLCESGKIITTSEQYTPRVLLISGEYMQEITSGNIASDSIYGKIFQMVTFINNDAFWKAQISQLHIDKTGDITIYPQVTKQYVEFGEAESIREKFIKMKYFYTKILPFKGWNYYARVNVKFGNQIICE